MNQAPVFTSRPGVMRALLETFVPAASGLDEHGLETVLHYADGMIAGRGKAIRRQVVLALNVLRLLSLLRFGRPLTRLDADVRRRFLESLQDAPVLKLRQAVWGLRTLLFGGYYADPARQPELGYRPHLRGWEGKDGHATR